MKKDKLQNLFENFTTQRVLVVGDVMIDAYMWGKVDRISPEAPVPIVQIQKRENRLGGAANVGLNIIALGAQTILLSVIGNDKAGEELENLVLGAGMSKQGIIRSDKRITTVKTRVISNHQHIVRVDEEQHTAITADEETALINKVEELLKSESISVLLFEDYNKGVLTERVITSLIQLAKLYKIPTCVDPKKDNFFTYKGVTLFKPNLKELREGLKIDSNFKVNSELQMAVVQLEKELHHDIALITLSERGVYIRDGVEEHFIPAHVRNIADVSGAGDTVIAVAALCLAAKTSLSVLAQLANLAGGLVCEKVGVVPIDKETLIEEATRELKG